MVSTECRASAPLVEFCTLNGKMNAADSSAVTIEGYKNGTSGRRTGFYATKGRLMTHAESIDPFKDLGAKFTPELKSPTVEMSFSGFKQADSV